MKKAHFQVGAKIGPFFVLGHVDFYVIMKNQPKPTSVDGKAFRDAIVDCYLEKATVRNVPHLYDVPKQLNLQTIWPVSTAQNICPHAGISLGIKICKSGHITRKH